jgi:nucleotide-binding universal stress UspA family protein
MIPGRSRRGYRKEAGILYRNILLMKNGCMDCKLNPCLGVLLAKSLEAKVTAVYVTENLAWKEIRDIFQSADLKWPGAGDTEKEAMAAVEKRRKELANQALEKTEKMCTGLGIPVEKVHLSGESPVQGVLKVAADKRCDLIVTSLHPHGLKDLLFDTMEAKTLGHAKIPVLCHHCA